MFWGAFGGVNHVAYHLTLVNLLLFTLFFAGRQPTQQDLILVLDTNILLSHLDYIKRIRSHGLAGILSLRIT